MDQKACQIDFYHLTSSDLGSTVALLSDKIVGSNKTAIILCSQTMSDMISAALWETTADNFLAHGIGNEPLNPNAPLWLVHDPNANPINADYAMLTSGLEIDDVMRFERLFLVFDGTSEFELSSARKKWKNWSQIDDISCRYFSQDGGGKWSQKA